LTEPVNLFIRIESASGVIAGQRRSRNNFIEMY